MQKKALMIVFGFAVLIALLGQSAPKAFDWKASLDPNDKNPFGLYVLNQQIDALFPAGVERLSFSPFERLSSSDTTRTNVLSLGNLPDGASLKKLQNHAHNGNDVFIAAPELQGTPWGKPVAVYVEEASVSLSGLTQGYTLKERMVAYFEEVPPNAQVLGHIALNNAIYPNFVRVPQGEGWVYLHADALIFSNYGLLFQNPDYATAALSYLNAAEPLIWYNPRHRKVSESGLRYVLSEPMLRNAWFMALGGILLFFVFNARRKQRVIPVIEPPRNTSIDFARTLGNLYRIEGDAGQALSRKIVYFLERIRHEYHLNTAVLNERFVGQLAHKTGWDPARVQQLIDKINRHLQKRQPATQDDLMAINNLIEQLFNERGRENSV